MLPSAWARIAGLVVATVVVGTLSACGGSGTDANDPNDTTDQSSNQGDPSTLDAETPDDNESENPDAAPGLHEVDGTVRVINLYTPKGGSEGTSIDVWAGTPDDGGKKLATVPYGEVSEELTPLSANEEYDGTTQFHVNYFPAGKTSTDDMLGGTAEFSAPGLKLTLPVLGGDEGELGGASPFVFVDAEGDRPKNAGKAIPAFPEVPAGKSILLLSAESMVNAYDPEGFSPRYVAASADGACLPLGDPPINKLDPGSQSETGKAGSAEEIPVILDPGAELTVRQATNDGDRDSECKSGKVLQTVSPKLEAGQRAYAFIHGVTYDKVQVLVVPALAATD